MSGGGHLQNKMWYYFASKKYGGKLKTQGISPKLSVATLKALLSILAKTSKPWIFVHQNFKNKFKIMHCS